MRHEGVMKALYNSISSSSSSVTSGRDWREGIAITMGIILAHHYLSNRLQNRLRRLWNEGSGVRCFARRRRRIFCRSR